MEIQANNPDPANLEPPDPGSLQAEIEHLKQENTQLRQALAESKQLIEKQGALRQPDGGGDFTGWKKAEKIISHERELWQTLFKHIPVMLTLYRPDLQLLEFNPQAEAILGWTSEDMSRPGFNLMEKLYPDPEYRAMVEDFMYSLKEGWRDFYVTAKDGSRVESSWSNIRLSDDTYIGIGIDLRERKRVERFLRDVLDNLFIFVGVLTPEGVLVEVNRSPLDAAGITTEDVVGKHFADTYWWEYSLEAQTRVRQAIDWAATGGSSRFDIDIKVADGRHMAIDFMIAPVLDSGGQVRYLIPSAVDISERKHAEEELRRNRELLHAIIDNASAAIYAKDLEGRFILSNRYHARVIGRSFHEIVGKTDLEVLPSNLWQEPYAENDRLVLDQQMPVEFEEAAPGLDGNTHTYLSVKFPLIAPGGEIYGVGGISTDITERKLAEVELIQLKAEADRTVAQLQAIMDSMADGLVIADPSGNILYQNPVAMALHGYQRPEEFQRPVADTALEWEVSSLAGRELPPEEWPMARALRGERFTDCELYVQRKNGARSFTGSYTGTPVLDQTGQMLFAIMTIRDITSRKEAEEALQAYADQLEQANRELEFANQELKDFAFIASHDLQEPLRKVKNFGELLRDRYGQQIDPHGQEYILRMLDASRRMQEMIKGLLDYSRISTRGNPFEMVDLRQITEAVLADLEIRLEQSNGTVEIGDLASIEADPLQMRQLLQNLLGNALKFHRDGTPPRVRVWSEPGDVPGSLRLMVADSGIGFDERYLAKLFLPFARLRGRSEYEGTGMGLAICRKIVERHGGQITANSQPGQGATFILTLPVQQRKTNLP